MANDGSYAKYTKKEVVRFERERERLETNVGGIRGMEGHPDALFVVDPHNEDIAVREANKLGIPVVGVCDTNCDPSMIDYVIPGNDDAIRAIRLFSSAIADACLEGSKRASQRREESAREAAKEAQEFHVPDEQQGGPEVQHISKGDDESEGDSEAEETDKTEAEQAPAGE
jgi:small subunit ribosomal protein S2